MFNAERDKLKHEYLDGNISHKDYITESFKFGEKEEKVFRGLAVGIGLTFATDVGLSIIGHKEEY